jgi:predicted MFS family arabinose efflux permease
LRGRPSPALRLAFAGALSVGGAVGVGRFVYTPILPSMAAALGLGAGTAGWIASANFIGYLAGALIATHPRFARAPRFWLFAALLLSAITTAAMGGASLLPLFAVLRAVGGLASAFVLVFASTVVLARLEKIGRGDLSSIHFAGVGAAIAVSAAVTSVLAAAGFDWRAMWVVSGAMTLLAMLGAVALVSTDMDGQPPPPVVIQSGGGESERKGALSLMLAYGLFGFGYVVTATFLVSIVKAYPDARPVEPYVWLLVGLCAVPSVSLWTFIGHRIGARRAFALACIAEALGVAVSVLSPTALGSVAAAVLLGGTYMGITALGLVAARRIDPFNAPRILGRMTAAFAFGQMVGPAFAGWLAASMGSFGPASLIAAAALLAAAALTLQPLR